MIGIESLDDYFARSISASAASGNLRYELKSSFRGPKIRHIQRGVGGNNTYQCYKREVMTFGNHLCSYKNIDFPHLQRPKYFLLGSLSGSGIRIHSLNPGMGEKFLYFFFQFLCADSVTQNTTAPAGWTKRQRFYRVIAVKTFDYAFRDVILQ